jgi:tRNA(Ile)-lysidine synthase
MKISNRSESNGFLEAIRTSVLKGGLEHYLMEAPLVVGVSGGADSLALVEALRALRGPLATGTLHVAHLNHGFRGREADQDATFVRKRAVSLGLPCTVASFDVPAYARSRGLSDEEAARRVRYAFLAGLAGKLSAHVAVGHSADDQVETVLMHLLRGAGTGGLGGMQMLSPLPVSGDDALPGELVDERSGHEIMLFRPMLGVWRSEIDTYCAKKHLQPRIDATNADPSYTRNRVRHELIPVLERDYSSAVKKHLLNLSSILSEESRFLDDLARTEAVRIARVSESAAAVSLDQAEFAGLPEALRRRVARWALETVAGTLEGFTFQHTEETARVLAGQDGAPAAADLPHDLAVTREGNQSVVRKRPASEWEFDIRRQDHAAVPLMDSDQAIVITPGHCAELEGGWRFRSATRESSEADPNDAGPLRALFDLGALAGVGPLVLRTRRPGDFMRPLGMKGSKSLQDSYVDAKIPRWLRARIPVVALADSAGEVLWVPGVSGRRAVYAPVGPGTRRILELEFFKTGDAPDDNEGARGNKGELSTRRH